MNTFIMVWVLVMVPNTNQSSPFISLPVADLPSCQRMQTVFRNHQTSQCVEVKIAK